MHHGIATAIATDLVNRRRNRKEFPQLEASLAIFIANASQPYRYCAKRLLESGQACGHHLQLYNVGGLTSKPLKISLRTVLTA